MSCDNIEIVTRRAELDEVDAVADAESESDSEDDSDDEEDECE